MFDITRVGENIRFYRKKNGMTQTEIAEKLHVSFQAVSGWECGTALPDLENLCRLSELLDVSVDHLLRINLLSEENVMIGIDGGGSKTEFVLFTSSGHVLGRFVLSGSNEAVVGFDETIRVLTEGIDCCLNKCANVRGVFIGIAGGRLREIERILQKKHPTIPFFVKSDAKNAFSSAEGDVALICGTGSILLYKGEDGDRFKGGWGYRMGDPGSAYNIGRAAIRTCLSFEDGIGAASAIYPLVRERLECDLVHTGFADKSVSEIAALSTAVFAAYRMGDSVAREILEGEMRELAPFIMSAAREGGPRVILCGGIMEHHADTLLPILRTYVSSAIDFILPSLPPVYGACIECCRHLGIEMEETFGKTFEGEYATAKING